MPPFHRLSRRTVADRGSPRISMGLKSDTERDAALPTFEGSPPGDVDLAAFGCRLTLRRARFRFFISPLPTISRLLIGGFFNFLKSAQRKLPNCPITKLENPHPTTHARIRRSSEAGASASRTTNPS